MLNTYKKHNPEARKFIRNVGLLSLVLGFVLGIIASSLVSPAAAMTIPKPIDRLILPTSGNSGPELLPPVFACGVFDENNVRLDNLQLLARPEAGDTYFHRQYVQHRPIAAVVVNWSAVVDMPVSTNDVIPCAVLLEPRAQ